MTADLEPKLTMLSVELAASGSGERQYAFLIYADDDLVAVLAQAQHPTTMELRRSWVLEASVGPCSGPGPTVWHDLGEFHQWVLARGRLAGLGAQPDRPRGAARRCQGARAGGGDAGPEVWRAARWRKTRTDLH